MAARVIFVTGKGGSGKSILARALAGRAAAAGHDALLLRLHDDAAAAASLRTDAPSPGTPRDRESARRTAVRERILDPARELEAFLARATGVGFIARRLAASRSFNVVAQATPGLGDLVTMLALAEAAASRRGVVVVDAPASGHAAPLVEAPGRVLALAPFGPVASEARRAMRLVADPRAFAAVVVATPEELPLVEAAALASRLAAAGVARVVGVANACWPRVASDADEDALAAQCPDAAAHVARRRREEAALARHQAGFAAACRIGFSFEDALDDAEMDALLAHATGNADGARP